MLFHVEMTVHPPAHIAENDFKALVAEEKAKAQELQQKGVWRHLWRVAGQYANVSIFDVESIEQLHEVMMGLPLFPFMTTHVTPLCRHPSSIRDDDR